MRFYVVFVFGFLSMILSACLTIGCADREDRIVDQSDNCCPSCDCEPRIQFPDPLPGEQVPGPLPGDEQVPQKNQPNITIIIDNKSDSNSNVDSDINNCTKQYNMIDDNEFEMTKKCAKKAPCYGKGKWKKYNGHYVLNYALNSCDDVMLEQVPCAD